MRKSKALPIKFFIPIYLCVVVLCVVLDQLSKSAMCYAKNEGLIPIRIIGDWLTLVWITNDGATGGMFSNLGWQNWLFFFMTLVGLPVFFWLLLRSRTRSVWGQIAFAFIMGGTIGNAIDRFRYGLVNHVFFGGEVRDFIKVDGFFGIFNIADSFLVVGVILALLAIIFFDPDSLLRTIIEEKQKKNEND
ncbi:MAG: signal peptidase II [Clostridiales bacterium]|nr:signal peptidase II [Clostridiales bacterium]